MNSGELDQLARAVARELGLREGAAAPAREVPDVSWRMPVASQGRIPVAADPPAAFSTHGASPVQKVVPGGAVRVADFVDHTLLKPESSRAEIEKICSEAEEHRFAAVCVNGCWVPLCVDLLRGTDVMVATVVGFPLGAMRSRVKAFEAQDLVEQGADEIDMVAAFGHILDDDWDYVEDDIRAVVDAAGGKTVKVILETGALQPLQVVKAAAIAKVAGAHFVKTSTGFHSSGGATPEAVALMRLAVGDSLGVKASGGVRDCTSALRMIAAGANRLGTSSGVNLVRCIGAGPVMMHELLADPDSHERVCLTGNCPSVC